MEEHNSIECATEVHTVVIKAEPLLTNMVDNDDIKYDPEMKDNVPVGLEETVFIKSEEPDFNDLDAEALVEDNVVSDEKVVGCKKGRNNDAWTDLDIIAGDGVYNTQVLNINSARLEGILVHESNNVVTSGGVNSDISYVNNSAEQTNFLRCKKSEYNRQIFQPINEYHPEFNSGADFYCNICRATFSKKSILRKHVKTHTDRKTYQCHNCKRTFSYKCNLKRHIKIHNGPKPFQCLRCTNKFSHHYELIRHTRTHTGDKQYKCEFCNKCFCRQDSLIGHIRIHTEEKQQENDKSFLQKADVNARTRTHIGYCNGDFTERSDLNCHRKTHNREKPYKCIICNKSFSQRHHLINHIRIHTGETPYKCEFCNKGFPQLVHLTEHRRMHTGEKPHKCDFCDKCFSRRTNLNVHIRTHTGYKPFKCNMCDQKFSYRDSLKGHARIHACENMRSNFKFRRILSKPV